MDIKWAALAQTAGVSFTVTVALVALFALGVRALTARHSARTAGDGDGALALSGAVACFAGCAAAVAYGLYLIAVH